MINAKKTVQENARKEDLVANAKLLEAFIYCGRAFFAFRIVHVSVILSVKHLLIAAGCIV